MNKSLKFSLIGAAVCVASLAAFSAWGAESIYTMIANGELAISQVKQAKATHQQLEQKSKSLAAMAQSIKEAQPELNQAVQKHNAASKQLQSGMAAYKKNCQKHNLSPSQEKQCKAQQKELNAQINQINAETHRLQAKQQALTAKIARYNKESTALNTAAPNSTNALHQALNGEQDWLNKARNLVASPAFASYRKAAGCPEVKTPPKTASAMNRMTSQVLDCLRNLAYHHSSHKASAAGTKR
ncbi:MAG: hypothetical protein ACRESR_11165 [Gammaproteobacteria bacterium]